MVRIKSYNICKALIKSNGKYLLLQAGANTVNPKNKFKWDLPGGRIKPGETTENTIVREVREETGLDTKIIKKFDKLRIDLPGEEIDCQIFLLRANSNEVELSKREHISFKWLSLEDFKSFELVSFVNNIYDYLIKERDKLE